MASPVQTNGVHPSTPPPSDAAAPAPSTTAAASLSQPRQNPDVPLTSVDDTGDSKRPREARLIHLVLSSMGVQSYQERVPLQLLDFAYRYTSSVLSDSLRLSQEGYAGSGLDHQRGAGRGRGGGGAGGDTAGGGEGITVRSLRQAIASRQGYTFAGHLPKEFMLEQAAERNRVALPRVEQRSYGVQLPEEKYCLTGTGWGLKEEWESEEDDEETQDVNGHPTQRPTSAERDEPMAGADGEFEEDDDEEGAGRMEDVFGEEAGGDTSMTQD